MVLPPPTQGEDTLADYSRTGLSLGAHPLQQIRARLRAAKCLDSRRLRTLPNDSWVKVAGIVTQRQRPQTASGVTFVTLEDEHGMVNVIVWQAVAERYRRVLLESTLLGVDGQWQVADGVCHLIARGLRDMSGLLGALDARSRDFR